MLAINSLLRRGGTRFSYVGPLLPFVEKKSITTHDGNRSSHRDIARRPDDVDRGKEREAGEQCAGVERTKDGWRKAEGRKKESRTGGLIKPSLV